MKTERKNWVALAALLIIFSGVAAAVSTYNLTLDPASPVEGSTLFVTVLKDGIAEPGVMVQFVLNNGLPVFNMTDSDGKARFKPPAVGSLNIYATTQDGVLLASNVSTVVPAQTTTPAPTSVRSSGGGGGGTYPPVNVTATATAVNTVTAAPADEITETSTPVQPQETEGTTQITETTPVSTEKAAPGFGAIIAVFAITMLASLLKNNRNRR